jgi:hypothetical protein
MEGARARSEPRSLTGSRGRATQAVRRHLGAGSSPQRASEEVGLSRRAEDNTACLGARTEGPSIEDPQDRPVPVTRRPPSRVAARSVKLHDRSSRGVVKHLMTRVARRGFFSDGRAAAAQADASPRASDDSARCTCLASRLQKSKRSIFPGPYGGEAVALGESSRRLNSPRTRGVARDRRS